MNELAKALQPIMIGMVNKMAVLKKEFIDRMAENGGITKKAARPGCDLFIETLIDCMAEDEKVMIKGFGRFEMRHIKSEFAKVLLAGKLYYTRT